MFLTHLVERYESYNWLATMNKGYKILDNSLIELGDAMSLERVLAAAEDIGAHEIVLPDKFLDCDGTLERVERALSQISKEPGDIPYKLMAVVHGKDEADWFRCFEALNKIPAIDVLGIPKITHKLHPDGRKYFVNNITTDKEIHLLGVWNSFNEFKGMDTSKVRGVDTSLTCILAKHDLAVNAVRDDSQIIDLDNDLIYIPKLKSYMKEVDDYVASL